MAGRKALDGRTGQREPAGRERTERSPAMPAGPSGPRDPARGSRRGGATPGHCAGLSHVYVFSVGLCVVTDMIKRGRSSHGNQKNAEP